MTVEIQSYLDAQQTDASSIPVVDVSTLVDGSDFLSVADQISHVCENLGFLYVVNHGVSADLIQRVRSYTERFFELPFAEKDKLNIVNSGPTLRGYMPLYGENVDPKNTKDFKETFDLGAHEDAVSPFFGPNQMPVQALPGFKETLEEYHAEMLKLARKLIGAIALSLSLPFDYFHKKQQKPVTIQRIAHYPPQTGGITRERIGIGEHTDYSFLTIVWQDDVGGLQVKNRAGEWITAPPIEGTFIVNIGDMTQTITNDRYVSTLHRVINASGKHRYSFPFFIDMDFDAVVEPVHTCVSDDRPSKYQPYTSGKHRYGKFLEIYAHLKAEKSAQENAHTA